MAFRILDRVHETTPAGWGGTGPVQLAGAALDPAGLRVFSAELGSGDETPYVIAGADGEWEETVGAWSPGSPPTLSRLAAPIRSSAGGALVDFTAGVKDVFAVVPGAYFEQSPVALTISAGAVSLRQAFHTIDAEGGAAADDLDALNWGPIREGQRVALMAASADRLVYLTASSSLAVPCLLTADRPTEFRRIGDKLWPTGPEVLLGAQTASGSPTNLDFQKGVGFAGFRRIRVEFDNLVPATDGVEAYLRWFFGGVIDQSGSFYGNLPMGGLTSGTTVDGVLQANAVLLARHAVGNVTTEGLSGAVSFVNAAAAQPKRAWGQSLGQNTGNVGIATAIRGYNIRATANLDGLRLTFSSGAIAAGSVRVYGEL